MDSRWARRVRVESYRTVPCRTAPYHTMWYRAVPYCTVPYHTVVTISYRSVPCRIYRTSAHVLACKHVGQRACMRIAGDARTCVRPCKNMVQLPLLPCSRWCAPRRMMRFCKCPVDVHASKSACNVAVSCKPPMLVTWVRLPACADVRRPRPSTISTERRLHSAHVRMNAWARVCARARVRLMGNARTRTCSHTPRSRDTNAGTLRTSAHLQG